MGAAGSWHTWGTGALLCASSFRAFCSYLRACIREFEGAWPRMLTGLEEEALEVLCVRTCTADRPRDEMDRTNIAHRIASTCSQGGLYTIV